MEAAIAAAIGRSTASGWTLCVLAIGGIIVLLKILAAQRPKMRELEIAADGQRRESELTESTSLRAAFVGEMTALREEITAARLEIKDLRGENGSLRDEVRQLHGIIDGMRREALQAGLSTQRAMVEAMPRDFVPPATAAALDRIKGVGE